MPKDKRSGKQIRSGDRYNEYDVIGTANNGSIKILKAKDETGNNGTPLFSNSRNTTYFIAKDVNGVNTITNIAIYKNRNLVESIDLNEGQGVHYHKWTTGVKRGKTKQIKSKDHFPALSPQHTKLIKLANEWNEASN